MKNILNITFCALLAVGMMACGGKKLTEDDLKKAESTLMDENGEFKKEKADEVSKMFCQYVEQNPSGENAPEWLFKAMQIEIKAEHPEKAIELEKQLEDDYPDYKNTPAAMLFLANYVYDSQLHDLDQAKAVYERIVDKYPDSELIPTVEKCIEYLGLTPEEILTKIGMSHMEEVEGEF